MKSQKENPQFRGQKSDLIARDRSFLAELKCYWNGLYREHGL